MVVVDGEGIPLGNLLDSASPAEVTLLEPTLKTIAWPMVRDTGIASISGGIWGKK
jgi:hypothetical protein